MAIEPPACRAGLGFLPVAHERYDLVVPVARRDRPAVIALGKLLEEPAVRRELETIGMQV